MSKPIGETKDVKSISIGLDDGYADTKIALPDGRLIVMPSRARHGQIAVTAILDAENAVAEYETEDTHYTVGTVSGESTEFEGYAVSGLNRSIVQHALQMANLGGRCVHAVSGLPMSSYYNRDGSQRSVAIEAKRLSLLKPVRCSSNGRSAEITFHAVIPEALAAWYDYVIDDSSAEPILDETRAARPVAIVDIGGRTTDFVVVRDQGLVHAASGSVQLGVLDLKNTLASAIQTEFGLERIDERLVSGALSSGKIRLFGQDHEVSAALEAAKRDLIAALHNETRRKLGRGDDVDAVYLVGGGANVLADRVEDWFPHQTLAEHAGFANARGMLKYLRYVCDEGA